MIDEIKAILETQRPRPTMIFILAMINMIFGNRKNKSDDVK